MNACLNSYQQSAVFGFQTMQYVATIVLLRNCINKVLLNQEAEAIDAAVAVLDHADAAERFKKFARILLHNQAARLCVRDANFHIYTQAGPSLCSISSWLLQLMKHI